MSLITKLDPRHWRYAKRLFGIVRHTLFTVGGTGTQITTDATLDEVRRALGARHFTNSWELSYRYEGEDLNMRRPEYKDDEYEWYQLHVRGFEREDGGVDLTAHMELEPTAHPYKHIAEEQFSLNAGVHMLGSVLDDAGIEYELTA